MYQRLTLILTTLTLLPTLSWGGGTFTTPPALMDPTYNETAYTTIASCYNSLNNQVVFSWATNPNPGAPFYAIYSATTEQFTQLPVLMNEGYTQDVWSNVFNCYNSLNNEIIFSWVDYTAYHNPYYSIYNATSKTFTTPAKINESYTIGAKVNVVNCYNSLNNEIIFSWADNGSGFNPSYSVYNATLQTFTTPAKINDSYNLGVVRDVYCCYNSQNNEIIFTWADNTTAQNPYYSVYNATLQTFTTPAKINDSYNLGVVRDVFCCYNSLNNEIIFSWADNTNKAPYYSVYNATLQTFTTLPAVIDESYTQGVYFDVFCSYNNQNNQTIFSWTDNTSHYNPYYAIYTERLPQRVAANRLLHAQTLSSMNWQKGVITKSSSSDN